tara:strand:+ start:5219 stop:5773 length:555 start_codon:yes stop_codon:yes gene_type:complete
MDNCKIKKYKGTFLVRAQDVKEILYNNYKDEIQRIELAPTRTLYKDANTVYFLNKIFKEMKNLRWMQISLSKNSSYSRVNQDEETGSKSIGFNFKVVRGSFRTFDLFKEKEMERVNGVLTKIGAIKNLQYSIVKLNSLIERLESTAESAEDIDIKKVCGKIINYFELWIEDDPETLIVTDYLDI